MDENINTEAFRRRNPESLRQENNQVLLSLPEQAGEAHNRILERLQGINKLQEYLLGSGSLSEKIKAITDGVVEIFQADFCRIWIVRPGDLCDSGCRHSKVASGPHVCESRDRCLHLVSSSGRYTNIDGGHQRVPIGAYKIGKLAVKFHSKFLSNNVKEDPQIHDNQWAAELGLQSFAGYQLRDVKGVTVGVMALFSKHTIEPEDDGLLESLGNSTAQVIQTSKTKDSLKESEEKYRKIFNNEIDAISIFDIETKKIVDVNDAFLKLYGYTREEALQLTTDALSGEPEKTASAINKAFLNEGDTLIPIRYHKKRDGTPIVVEISAGPFTWKGQRVMFAVARDITEHIKAEESLTRSEKKYRNLFRNSNDGIYVLDLGGNIVEVNRKALEQSGMTQDEIVSCKFMDLLAPESRQKAGRLFQEVLDKRFVTSELVGRKKNGELFPIEISSSLLDLEGEKIIQSVVRDISERKKLEEELLKVQKLESIGILAGGIAHDFNNLLMAILGNISLAKIYTSNIEVTEKLNDVEKASIRAQNLTQQLLTFSKGGEPVRKPVDISDLLRETATFILTGSNVKSDFSIAEDLWPVMADEGQISQVIQNLVKNADQSMPDGGTIIIRAANKVIGQRDALPLTDGKYIEIMISDTGAGISKEDSPKIFDPYFSTKKQGSGLGLATAYSIIKKHDGFITVESRQGEGATFYIYLPVSDEKPVLPEITEDKKNSGEGRILLMDDEDSIVDVSTEMLNLLGYSVVSAKEGNEVIALYKRALEENNSFDAVLLDLTIPGGMGGKETMKKLREIDPNVKCIISSGYANDSIMSDFSRFGCSGVVAKPYTIGKLRNVLIEVLT